MDLAGYVAVEAFGIKEPQASALYLWDATNQSPFNGCENWIPFDRELKPQPNYKFIFQYVMTLFCSSIVECFNYFALHLIKILQIPKPLFDNDFVTHSLIT